MLDFAARFESSGAYDTLMDAGPKFGFDKKSFTIGFKDGTESEIIDDLARFDSHLLH